MSAPRPGLSGRAGGGRKARANRSRQRSLARSSASPNARPTGQRFFARREPRAESREPRPPLLIRLGRQKVALFSAELQLERAKGRIHHARGSIGLQRASGSLLAGGQRSHCAAFCSLAHWKFETTLPIERSFFPPGSLLFSPSLCSESARARARNSIKLAGNNGAALRSAI